MSTPTHGIWAFASKTLPIMRTPYPKGTPMSRSSSYGLGSFIFDLILIFLTGGLWLIWIFVREMRGLR